jgi:hypothetical protein
MANIRETIERELKGWPGVEARVSAQKCSGRWPG